MTAGGTPNALVVLTGAAVLAVTASVASASRAHRSECQSVASADRRGYVCLGALPTLRTRVALTSRNGSHEHGTALITFGLHETDVVLRLSRPTESVKRTAFLRIGGCWGAPAYELGKVVDGRLVTTIDPLPRVTGVSVVVRVHKAAPGNVVVACGVIPRT
jgi:hypothetical protein